MSTISGTSGNDVLSTSTPGDFVDAGAGNDQVTIVMNSSADGGTGDDLLVMDLHTATANLSFSFTDGGSSPYPFFSGYATYIQNFESIHLTTGSGNDTGYFYPSPTTSTWGPDTWDAGAGTDLLAVDLTTFTSDITAGYINTNTYQVSQSDAAQSILMTAYNVENLYITGGHGNTNTISGGAGNDILYGYATHNYISGGDGNDVLYGHGGTLDGGNGFDTALVDYSPAYLSVNGEAVTFNGDGSITLTDNSGTTVLKNIEMVRMYQTYVLMGTLGNDTVTMDIGDDMFMGGPGDDTITVPANSGSNIIDGGAGNDTVLFSSPIANYIIGTNSKGDVTVTAQSGYVTTLVNVETVQFNGAVAEIGGSGNDSLTGTSGNDVLFGGGGNDTLDGGGGNDTAVFSGNYSDSVITFNLDGSFTVTGPDGTDTLHNIENVKFSDESAVLGTIGNDSVTVTGVFDSTLVGFVGGPGNDTVTANTGQLFFDGGPGTDTIIIQAPYAGFTATVNGSETDVGLARLMNVEIVKFNNGTATLSNGQLIFTAAQPALNNNGSTVSIPSTGYATTLAPSMTITNPDGSPITGAVVKIATGFVSGDLLTVNTSGTSISSSYDATTGTLTLSGAETTAHYQQALNSVQMIADATYNNDPFSGSVTWQVTNSDASQNVSPLATTQLSLPIPGASIGQINEAIFISGVNPNGTIASQSFQTWQGDAPAHYDPQYSDAVKWGANTAGTSGGTVSYYFDPSSNWTPTEEGVFREGLALWSAVANINFTLTTNPVGADITFVRGHDGAAEASANFSAADSNVGRINGTELWQFSSATISIDTSVPGFGPIGSFSTAGGYTLMTVLHEEGHALGLGHAGPYNEGVANNTFDSNQEGIYDNRLWSLMSYIDPDDTHAHYYPSYSTTGTNWGNNVPTTPMPLDIMAAQLLYGLPASTPLSGGQVFGFNTNITGDIRPFFDFTQNTNPVVTLWDTGTNNTLDLSGFSITSTVNLNPGTVSSADGMTNNISIPFGTKIDEFIGGAGNDSITANNDGDTLFGGPGNDTFVGGAGNDTMDGGPGFDKVVYSGNYSAYAVTTNANGSVSVAGQSGTDTLTNIEELDFADRTVPITSSLTRRATNDFDGDGKSDLLWQNSSTGQAAIWLMNGISLVTAALAGSNTNTAWHVIGTGDFDGDGKSDIVWQNSSTGQASIWLMNGTSLVSAAQADSNTNIAWHVIGSGDFDGDGKSDLVWQNSSTGQVSIWLMNGTSLVSAAQAGSNTDTAWHVIGTGDFNGDGKSDLVWQNSSTGQAEIWLMNGTSLVSAAQIGSNTNTDWHVIGAGDFDGDGKSDLVWQNSSTGQAAVWLMNGTSLVSATQIGSNTNTAWHVTGTGDFDGDGKSDIVWQNSSTGQAAVWLMNGTSLVSAAQVGSNTNTAWHITAAAPQPQKSKSDFDGDGKSDLLWQNSSTGQAAIWLMNGTSLVTAALAGSNTNTAWHVIGTGDFDGDGKSDIVWQNSSTGQASIWLMNGTSLVSAAQADSNTNIAWHVIGSGDFDGDGKSDLVWQNSSTGQVSIWLMNGTSLVSAAQAGSNTDTAWHVIGTGDFNGDGKSDLVWQNSSTGQAEIWLMNGTSLVSAAQIGSNTNTDWHVIGAGDFDGDGKSDLVWQNSSTGQAAVWLMNGTSLVSATQIGSNTNTAWHVTGTGDFDGDGKSDIVWQNSSTGQAAVWLMNGTSLVSAAQVGSNTNTAWHLVTG